MTVSTDMLNANFTNHKGPLINSFFLTNGFWERLVMGNRVTKASGTKIERTFTGEAPTKGMGIFAMDETILIERKSTYKKISVEPHRILVPIAIPQYELNQQKDTEFVIIQLIKAYAGTTTMGTQQDIGRFMATGQSRGKVLTTADMSGGFVTLNGSATLGSSRAGTSTGVLAFQAAADQSATVLGVQKSLTYDWYNQAGQITASNYATLGRKTLRKTYRQCMHSSLNGKGPDLVFMDDDTYANYEDERINLVRLRGYDDRVQKAGMVSLDFGGAATVYADPHLDRSLLSGSPAGPSFVTAPDEGATYMLNTDYWEFCFQQVPTVSSFEDGKPYFDGAIAFLEMQGNLICTHLAAQGTVVGGSS